MGELQVIGGLRDKRSELVELVGRLEQQLADYRVSLTHLDATMRLFDPDLLLADTDLQQRERVSWFRPGECLRTIYDVMREAPQPLTTRDVARRVIAAKGITVADDRTQSLIQKPFSPHSVGRRIRLNGWRWTAWSVGACVRRHERVANIRKNQPRVGTPSPVQPRRRLARHC